MDEIIIFSIIIIGVLLGGAVITSLYYASPTKVKSDACYSAIAESFCKERNATDFQVIETSIKDKRFKCLEDRAWRDYEFMDKECKEV